MTVLSRYWAIGEEMRLGRPLTKVLNSNCDEARIEPTTGPQRRFHASLTPSLGKITHHFYKNKDKVGSSFKPNHRHMVMRFTDEFLVGDLLRIASPVQEDALVGCRWPIMVQIGQKIVWYMNDEVKSHVGHLDKILNNSDKWWDRSLQLGNKLLQNLANSRPGRTEMG